MGEVGVIARVLLNAESSNVSLLLMDQYLHFPSMQQMNKASCHAGGETYLSVFLGIALLRLDGFSFDGAGMLFALPC